jgi:hypothetical protein
MEYFFDEFDQRPSTGTTMAFPVLQLQQNMVSEMPHPHFCISDKEISKTTQTQQQIQSMIIYTHNSKHIDVR